MALSDIKRNEDGSWDLPMGFMPSGEDLTSLRKRMLHIARTHKNVMRVVAETGVRPLVIRQLRVTDVEFQVEFDESLGIDPVARHRVGRNQDPVENELRRLKQDGAAKRGRIAFTPDLFAIVEKALSETGSLQRAADLCGVTVGALQKQMKDDSEFSEIVETALRRYGDLIRDAARSRAVEGYLVPMLGGKDRDQIVAYEPKFSDRLMELELKRVDPSYRDHKIVEQSTTVNVRHQLDIEGMSLRARSKLEELLDILEEDAQMEAIKQAQRDAAIPAVAYTHGQAVGALGPGADGSIIDAELADVPMPFDTATQLTREHTIAKMAADHLHRDEEEK